MKGSSAVSLALSTMTVRNGGMLKDFPWKFRYERAHCKRALTTNANFSPLHR